MNGNTVLYERRGTIALVTLNDPDRRNALSRDIVRGVSSALEMALRDGARAVVIAAAGTAFCAGANIDDLRNGWMESPDPADDPAVMFRRIAEFDRPVIAAVQGAAVGGGMELTLACDLVVAAGPAWFAMPELGHGVIPNTGLALLARVVGMRRAFEIVLTRRRVSSEESLNIGLVNRVLRANELLEGALSLAGQIVESVPPGALKAARLNLQAHAAIDWGRVLRSPLDVPRHEWLEGLDAFTQKRAPEYDRFWEQDDGSAHTPALQGVEGE
ncbi:enoyl-CoA hydratase/isomerase family protein [Paraburkholderia sp. Tr-20389]|uniref:enoyl-CoA hydratase/isomerase family protein n=1 Tax=Paraburkholderia sp. Tr-20389 TaxID=2703903 RepID=UPI00198107A3|nr:enoyl-CoA hydratase/isomerase family protein [Paraburkholderia sp. Tr-20389]MBN3756203.1 enoyl-CoA hydratase/isomerase family protein [Paraburkholderia sp. Tr-20389]